MKMTDPDWEVFEHACERADIGDVRTHYSGRGMYGRRCVGVVVGSMGEITRLAIELARDADTPEWLLDEMCDNAARDNMATDMIVYWPGVEAPS